MLQAERQPSQVGVFVSNVRKPDVRSISGTFCAADRANPGLGHTLGLEVLAEGGDTAEQF
jgi:hypothetical protein